MFSFTCDYDLRMYPFDTQVCNVSRLFYLAHFRLCISGIFVQNVIVEVLNVSPFSLSGSRANVPVSDILPDVICTQYYVISVDTVYPVSGQCSTKYPTGYQIGVHIRGYEFDLDLLHFLLIIEVVFLIRI